MKRSILFGVLAMFAVSAMSVQNVNAQDVKDEPVKVEKPKDQPANVEKPQVQPTNPAQSINDPKDKPKVESEEHSPIKGGNGDVNNNPKNVDPKDSDAVRTNQNAQGIDAEKQNKKPNVWDKTNKKSRPKKVKNQKMKKESNSQEVNGNENQQGTEGKKPSMVKPGKDDKVQKESNSKEVNEKENQGTEGKKPSMVKTGKNDKVQKESNSKEVNKNENQQGKENQKPGMVKPKDDKIQNNSQSSENKKNENSEGYSNNTKKNKTKPTLQKEEPKELPNSVARPPQPKAKQGTQTQNQNNAD